MPSNNQFSGSSMAASMGGSSNAAYNPYNLSNSSNNLFSGSGMASSMGGSPSGGVGAWGGVADWSQPFQGSSNAATELNSASGTVAGATGGTTPAANTASGSTTATPAAPTLAETLAGQISTDYGSINLTPDQQTYAATLTDPQRTLFENIAGWTGLESGAPGANPSMTQPNMPSFAYGGTGLDYSTITDPYSAAHTQFLTTPEGQTWQTQQDQSAAQAATAQAAALAQQQSQYQAYLQANPDPATRNIQGMAVTDFNSWQGIQQTQAAEQALGVEDLANWNRIHGEDMAINPQHAGAMMMGTYNQNITGASGGGG